MVITLSAVAAWAFLVTPSETIAADKSAKDRSEIDDSYKWDLTGLYETADQWESEFAATEKLIDEISDFKGRLHQSADTFLEFQEKSEKLGWYSERILIFAGLKYHEDTNVSENAALWERARSLMTRISAAVSWVQPEMVSIPHETIEDWIAKNEKVAVYRHWFDDMWRTQEYTLSEKEERVLALAGDLAGAPTSIFEAMTNADLKFGTFVDSEGDEVEMTQARYGTYMQDPDRDVRDRAWQVYYDGYERYINANAAALAGAVKRDLFYTRARGYESCAERALDADNVTVDLLDNLIATINENHAPIHKYNRIRSSVLGIDTLRHWDLYTPLTPELNVEISYEDAVKTILEGLEPLGDEYVKNLEMAFSSNWIDVYENKGKRSGAYSWGGYATGNPYVLLNYENKHEDMSTVAHEIGHALHTWYTINNQPQVYADYSIFVAEVASTTNEAILMNYLLEKEKDPMKRMFLINSYIRQIEGTMYTQVEFAEFERGIHDMAESGDPLTVDSMNDLYSGLLTKYAGPAVKYDERSGMGWSRIGHFHRNFYVYKYATSYAAATAFAKKILDGEPGVREKYLEFLKSGSSDYPVELLKEAGVDLSSPEPIQATCDLLAELVDELERLIKENGRS